MPKMLYWTGRESTNWFSASVYFFLLSVTSFFPSEKMHSSPSPSKETAEMAVLPGMKLREGDKQCLRTSC